jgi:hypothetical protein
MRLGWNTIATFLLSAPLVMASVSGLIAVAAEAEKSSPDPRLQGTIGQHGQPSATVSSVDSFFQLAPVKRRSPQDVRADAGALSGAGQSSGANEKKPVLKEVGRALWHVLDNAGVPMVLGKQNDLDPSIDTSHWMPPAMVPNLKRVDRPAENPKQTVIEGTAQIENGAVHKIPQSELEGIELPTLHDAQSPTH